MSANLVDVLSRRSDSTSIQHRECIEKILDERFIESHDHFDYALLPDMVLSTIAIAISSNGALVASTHGDHTVKIFQHDTGKFIHSFQGHPRTPWTVKFHPTDANFVASGCLGCEVRVWDIRNRICRAFIRLGFSIISLSFQPKGGAHIGIASGPQLLLWDWQRSSTPEQDDVMYRPKASGGSNQIVYPNQTIEPVLVHSRNIRAVIFHPCGTLAFAAAPDPPRQANAAPSPCRLYSFECSLLGNRNNVRHNAPDNTPPYAPPPLDSMPTLIPQIHLYSDGGLDISADGHYIFACTMLATRHCPRELSPPMPFCSSSSRRPSQKQEQMHFKLDSRDVDRHDDHGQDTCSSSSEFTTDTLHDSSSDSSDSSDSDDSGDGDVEAAREVSALGSALGSLTLRSSGTATSTNSSTSGHSTSNVRRPGRGRGGGTPDSRRALAGTRHLSDVVLSSGLALQLVPLALVSADQAGSYEKPDHPQPDTGAGWGGVGSFFSVGGGRRRGEGQKGQQAPPPLPRPVLPAACASSVVKDAREGRLLFMADPLHPPYPSDWRIEERLCLFKISLQLEKTDFPLRSNSRAGALNSSGSHDIKDPKTVTIIGSFTENDSEQNISLDNKRDISRGDGTCVLLGDALVDPYVVPRREEGLSGESKTEQQRQQEEQSQGLQVDVEDCISASVNTRPLHTAKVDLVQSKPLAGSLMRAVTSMKLSPSGRLGLIGYGVRVHDKVLDHTNPKVACEILDLTADMTTCCLMSDDIDEVNIAQFHPVSGSGVLYGTKRGKVRVFSTKKMCL